MGVSATYPLTPGLPGPTTSKGGQIPEPPFATDAYRVSIRRPPSKVEILDLLKRVTEPSYHEPIIQDPRGSLALYRQMACQFTTVGAQGFSSQQSAFYLPYPTQGDSESTSTRAATMLVTLRRTSNLDQTLVAEISTIVLFGPQGREYVNTERIVWSTFDPNATKTIEFISINPGFVGNLQFLADANGLLANPDGSPATDIVGLQPQSGAANTLASIVSNPGGQSSIVDNGTPDQFSEAHVGLYVEIVNAANAVNIGRRLQIVGYSQSLGNGPNSILVDDGPQQTQIFVALAYDGGVYTNETTAARNQTIDDMTLLPAAPVVADSYYFGASAPFAALDLTMSTPGVGTWQITWTYWDGNNYVPIPGIVDNTIGFTASGTQRVSFPIPNDWVIDSLNGVSAYYINAELTSFTSITTQPLGQIAYTYPPGYLTPEAAVPGTGTVSWAIRDWTDLGIEIIQIEAPTGGRDNTLRMLGEERGVYQQSDETDDQFRRRASQLLDVVSPNAIQRAVNRALQPFGFTGQVIDVGFSQGTFDQFDGWFYDVDAWDYYDTSVVQYAIADDGGVGTDETAAAQSETIDDMTLLPAAPVVLDRYFFGQSEPYSSLELDISTPGVGTWTIEWRYWDGVSSTPLTNVVDNSDGFKNVGVRTISWDVPSNWATENPFAVGSAYYIEARLSAFTSMTTQPLGRRAATAFQYPDVGDYKLFLSGGIGHDIANPDIGPGSGESQGWFFVILPCLPSVEDFGFAWDIDGPSNILDGQELAGAWDIMVWDGEATDANAAYAAIFNQINTIRAGGVGFTMLRDCNRNVPICP